MRILFIVLISFGIFFEAKSQKKLVNEKLITLQGETLKRDSLKKGIWVVLISTYECGYCIEDIEYNNELLEKYKGKINAFSLFELDSAKIHSSEIKIKKKLNWALIPKAEKIYNKYWKSGAFPEMQIYYNGKLVIKQGNLTDVNKKKVEDIIDELIKKGGK